MHSCFRTLWRKINPLAALYARVAELERAMSDQTVQQKVTQADIDAIDQQEKENKAAFEDFAAKSSDHVKQLSDRVAELEAAVAAGEPIDLSALRADVDAFKQTIAAAVP